MKNRFLTLLFAAMLAFCSLSALATTGDSCSPDKPEPPEPDASECMSMDLGE